MLVHLKVHKMVDVMFVSHGQVGSPVKVWVKTFQAERALIQLFYFLTNTLYHYVPFSFVTFLGCLHVHELSHLFFRTTQEINSFYSLFTSERIEAQATLMCPGSLSGYQLSVLNSQSELCVLRGCQVQLASSS